MTEKNFDLKYKYLSLLNLKWEFEEPHIEDVSSLTDNLKININTNFGYQKETQHFSIELKISLFVDKSNFQIFQIMNRHFFFLISDEKLVEEDDKGEFLNLPDHIFITFSSIAYSTTRGIVKEKLSGTRFSNILLPIIDPKTIAPSDKVRMLIEEPE